MCDVFRQNCPAKLPVSPPHGSGRFPDHCCQKGSLCLFVWSPQGCLGGFLTSQRLPSRLGFFFLTLFEVPWASPGARDFGANPGHSPGSRVGPGPPGAVRSWPRSALARPRGHRGLPRGGPVWRSLGVPRVPCAFGLRGLLVVAQHVNIGA